jgi:hypothetical protein
MLSKNYTRLARLIVFGIILIWVSDEPLREWRGSYKRYCFCPNGLREGSRGSAILGMVGITGIGNAKVGVKDGVTVVNPKPPIVVVVADDPSLKFVTDVFPIWVVVLLRPFE